MNAVKTSTNIIQKRKKEGGFSLVELMVVVAVIAVLATIAVPQFISASEKAKKAKEQADIQTISSAVQLYMSEKGTENVPNMDTLVKDGFLNEKVKTANGKEYIISYEIKDGSSVKKVVVKPEE